MKSPRPPANSKAPRDAPCGAQVIAAQREAVGRAPFVHHRIGGKGAARVRLVVHLSAGYGLESMAV